MASMQREPITESEGSRADLLVTGVRAPYSWKTFLFFSSVLFVILDMDICRK